MSAEEDRSIRSTHIENDIVTIGATAAVTWHMGTGTDTATDRYLNIPTLSAYGIEIIPYATAVSVTKINNRSLKAAMTIGTNGYKSNNLKIQSITIQAGATATVVEVQAKGGD